MSIRNENINALFLFRETGRDLLRQRVKYIARNASPHTNRLVCVLVQLIKVTSIIQFIIVKLYKREHIHRHFQKRSKIRLILHMYNKSWCVLWLLMLFLETLSLPCVVCWIDLQWDFGAGFWQIVFQRRALHQRLSSLHQLGQGPGTRLLAAMTLARMSCVTHVLQDLHWRVSVF